jgi:hypothetical protein
MQFGLRRLSLTVTKETSMIPKVSQAIAAAFAAGSITCAHAAFTVIPQSALIPSTTLYTTDIGGGIGNTLVMTGGGNGANVGEANGRNDDGFSGPINLGFTLNYFGNNYTQFFANNNGNISFGAGISAFTPTGLIGAAAPVISPFFADVDTRDAASGVMSLRTDIANQIIVTWPGVGYYAAQGQPLNTFQLVLRGPNYVVPVGEGRIGFFWTGMGWEVGSASGGGPGGVCAGNPASGTQTPGCSPAAIGFGDGQATVGSTLEGSQTNGIAGIVQNNRLWFDINAGGAPEVTPRAIPVPAAAWLLLSGLGLFGVLGRRRGKAVV